MVFACGNFDNAMKSIAGGCSRRLTIDFHSPAGEHQIGQLNIASLRKLSVEFDNDRCPLNLPYIDDRGRRFLFVGRC